MARIINTVGTLSVLKKELEERNLTQFHSIKDINEFERAYVQQIEDARDEIRRKLKSELETISTELDRLMPIMRSKHTKAEEEVNEQISKINIRIKSIENQKQNALRRFATHIVVSLLRRKIRIIENGRTDYIERSIRQEEIEQLHLKARFNELNYSFEEIVNSEVDEQTQQLSYTKASLDELRPVILGSIGESMVSSTLSSLPDSYVAINNVHIELFEPISYPSENDRIFSFQIDHVVVGPSGVFAIETKHWSQESLSNHDLFSPVKQVRRSGYALFRMINNGLISLSDSWGDRAISAHNIIVFTAAQVKQEYQHVKLLDLASLNGYIQWFDEGLAPADVDRIVSYVEGRCIK